MSGRRKPREVPAPSGMTLADYRASGALDSHLPSREYIVLTADGRQFSVHPMTPEGHEQAQATADRIRGRIEEYTPHASTYWKTGDAHYDH
jgi:hypothetical protein